MKCIIKVKDVINIVTVAKNRVAKNTKETFALIGLIRQIRHYLPD